MKADHKNLSAWDWDGLIDFFDYAFYARIQMHFTVWSKTEMNS